MNIFKSAWEAMMPKFLGGDVIETTGSVRGEPSMGITADPQKASGDVLVHRIQLKSGEKVVSLEMRAHDVPGDCADLLAVRLSPADALTLSEALVRAAQA